jgi:SAM-dependent methyltransferase
MNKLEKIVDLHRKVGTLKTLKIIAYKLYLNFFYTSVGFLAIPLKNDSSKSPYHEIFQGFVQRTNQLNQYKILELGARNVTGIVRRNIFKEYREYVGFDIHEGENVDVIGDIHQLSTYFPENSFDAVYSVSVFEHLAMPWKAVLEINKVMKEGGLLMISTHPTWPAHELPWDFWRFSESSFTSLLNPITGFEILSCQEGYLCHIVPFETDVHLREMLRAEANLNVAVLARKIAPPDSRLKWEIDTNEIISNMYPK